MSYSSLIKLVLNASFFSLFSSAAIATSTDPPLNIADANACVYPVPAINTWCANDNPPAISPSASVSISGTYTPVSGVSVTAVASGDSAYGVLKASASTSFDVSGSPRAVWAEGASAFRDVMTVSFAPWNGDPGLLHVAYTLDGTISGSGNGSGALNVQVYGGPTDSQDMFQTYLTSTSGKFYAPAAIKFIYGQPFNLGIQLWAEAGSLGSSLGDDPTSWPVSTTGIGSGSADFSNTLVLSGLVPTDTNGNTAEGATFSSESGTIYTTDGVIPEPADVFLILAGLCLIIPIARRRVGRI
jgi:hypothetical protein